MRQLNIKKWKPEEIEKYANLWRTCSGDTLCAAYGVSRRTISNVNKQLGLSKRRGEGEPKLKKKEPAVRKKRSDAMPVGTIYTHTVNGRIRTYIATEKGRMRLHIYNWLQAGNEIPKGFVLAFKERKEPEDCSVENLELKTRGQVAVRYRKAYVPGEPLKRPKRKKREKTELEIKEQADRKEQRRQERIIRQEKARQEAKRLKEEKAKERERKKLEAGRINAVERHNKSIRGKKKKRPSL